MAACPICQLAGIAEQNLGGPTGFACPRCGMFAVLTPGNGPFANGLGYFLEAPGVDANLRRSRLSHIVRHQQNRSRYVGVPVAELGAWGLDEPLPSPAEQFDNLIVWVGDQQASYAEGVTVRLPELAAWMGAPVGVHPNQVLGWIFAQQGVDDLIERRAETLRLTLAGWSRREALKRTAKDSRTAFMAMQFGDEQLNDAVEICFKPAAAAAGFQLRNLAEGQPAGLIDDQIRVAIRRAKFVIADLTHGNNGAYWEAGFAEGAGKPVIYTCHRDAWARQRTHFDTNHLATIIWDPGDFADAERRLTAMIRATLPSDAKLE